MVRGEAKGFVEAIQSGFANYTNFSGRSVRSAYWWWALFNALAVIVAQIIDTAVRPGGLAPRHTTVCGAAY